LDKFRISLPIGRLEISRVDIKRGIIAFKGYDSNIDNAKPLTNVKLYSTKEESRERCHLSEGEHFWFDLEGCRVIDSGEKLGIVEEMRRFGDVNYMYIATDRPLVDMGLPETFLIPYIDRYIVETDISSKVIYVRDGRDILETS